MSGKARNYKDLTKDEKTKRVLRQIKALFRDMPDNQMKLNQDLFEQAAFMKVTLEELREKINSEGAVIKGKNGNGFNISQEHPAQKSYNTMIKNYLAVMSKLNEMLPPEAKKSKLGDFLNG